MASSSYDLIDLYADTNRKKGFSKSMLGSMVLHLGLALTSLILVVPQVNTNKEVAIEYLGSESPSVGLGNTGAENTGRKTIVAAKKTAEAAPVAMVKASAAEPALNDIEASTLGDSDVLLKKIETTAAIEPAATLSEGELEDTFNQVDQQQARLAVEKNQNMLNQTTAETEQALAALVSETDAMNAATNEAMAQQLVQQKIQNQKNLQAVQQQEALQEAMAAQLAAENARKAQEARAQAAAALAAKNQQEAEMARQRAMGTSGQPNAAAGTAQSGHLHAQQAGSGADNASGSSGSVRGVQELVQQAGNPMPSYSVEERFKRQQGTVIYRAYVTAQGSLTQFQLVKSTGHPNLDQKTLESLRKWKFHPGQEGWVEIPQVWSLTGEEQELPASLRRQFSQN